MIRRWEVHGQAAPNPRPQETGSCSRCFFFGFSARSNFWRLYGTPICNAPLPSFQGCLREAEGQEACLAARTRFFRLYCVREDSCSRMFGRLKLRGTPRFRTAFPSQPLGFKVNALNIQAGAELEVTVPLKAAHAASYACFSPRVRMPNLLQVQHPAKPFFRAHSLRAIKSC